MAVDVPRLFREMEREAEEHGLDPATLDRPRMLRLWVSGSHLGRGPEEVTRADVDLARAALNTRRFTVMHMDACAPYEPPSPTGDTPRPRFLPIVVLPAHVAAVAEPCALPAEALAVVERLVRPRHGKHPALLVPVREATLAHHVVALAQERNACARAHAIEPWEWDDRAYVLAQW